MQDSSEREWALELLNAWRSSGNPEVLGQLIKWRRDRAYATALRILGNRDDAEDAVQQASIKLMSRTHGFENPEQFNLTVFRAVVQCALDMARANRVRTKLEKAMSPIERNQSPLPQLAAEQAEALRAVWQELHAMSEESRALVVLCYQEGLSVSDAAEALAIPRETLRDRLSASMADLRKKLSQRGVMLSLLVLVGLLREGNAEAAPASLCEALDHAIPGSPCAEIPAAHAPAPAPEVSVTGRGSSPAAPNAFSLSMGFGIAASLMMAAGIWFTLDQASAPAGKPSKVAFNSASLANNTGTSAESKSQLGASATSNVRQETEQKAPVAPPIPTPIALPSATARAVNGKKNNQQDAAITMEKVPAAVREAAQRAVAGITLKSAELNREEKTLRYEFKGDAGGKNYEIVIGANGKLVSVKIDDDDNDDDGEDAGEVKKKPVAPPAPPKADF